MDKQLILKLKDTFDSISHVNQDGIEYWNARELQQIFGYAKWDKFLNVINKAMVSCKSSGKQTEDHFLQVGKLIDIAKTACENSNYDVSDHFREVTKMIEMPKNATKDKAAYC